MATRYLDASELRPGDVVILSKGDERTIDSTYPAFSSARVGVQWTNGQVSYLSPGNYRVRR